MDIPMIYVLLYVFLIDVCNLLWSSFKTMSWILHAFIRLCNVAVSVDTHFRMLVYTCSYDCVHKIFV